MDLVEVDDIGLQATQTCLDLFEDCSSREAPVIGLGRRIVERPDFIFSASVRRSTAISLAF